MSFICGKKQQREWLKHTFLKTEHGSTCVPINTYNDLSYLLEQYFLSQVIS